MNLNLTILLNHRVKKNLKWKEKRSQLCKLKKHLDKNKIHTLKKMIADSYKSRSISKSLRPRRILK